MRIVADTHVVVSALLWDGPPRALLAIARQEGIALYTSAPVIAELEDVLGREKLSRRSKSSAGCQPNCSIATWRSCVS